MKLLHFEPTPNPNAIKCVIEPDPATAAVRSYFNAEQAQAEPDPLAHALFAIPGVANVLIHTAFVTIGKNPDAKWPTIKARVRDVLGSAEPRGGSADA